MDSSSSSKRPSFLEEPRALSSISDMEAGYSGYNTNNTHHHYHPHGFFSKPMIGYSPSSFYTSSSRNLSVSSPRYGRFYDARFEDHQPYFLDACFLCKKHLADDSDIFMYRGDVPFCSEECRQEQIESDEAKEKNRNLSSIKALRKKDQNRSASPNKAQDYSFRTGTVAAA